MRFCIIGSLAEGDSVLIELIIFCDISGFLRSKGRIFTNDKIGNEGYD